MKLADSDAPLLVADKIPSGGAQGWVSIIPARFQTPLFSVSPSLL
jgi:hypothetical protein